MENTRLKTHLIKAGLSPREASVYMALLELGVCEASKIVEKTGLIRSTMYVVLESLQKKGLVVIVEGGGIRKFSATHPDLLLRSIQNKLEKNVLLKQNLNTLLPQLKKVYRGSKYKPKINIYEGKEGMIKGFEETLLAKEEFLRMCTSAIGIYNHLPEYLPYYMRQRFQKGLRMHGIHPDIYMTQNIIKNSPPNFDQHALIPEEKFKFPADIALYDNKIGLMSPRGLPIAISIESKEFSDVLKLAFDLAWIAAKTYKKK